MMEPEHNGGTTRSLDDSILFGPFRLLPAQKLLLEAGEPVTLGARAFDLLVALTSRAGAVVSKEELMAEVWQGMFVEESNVRVHVAALRRALRDAQDGQRYIVNIPGRGYSFVAPVQVMDAADDPGRPDTFKPKPVVDLAASLPRSVTRIIGRTALIDALGSQLAQRRFVTLVGPGGIGKTTVAVAIAREVLGSYADGVCFVDFSSIRDPGLVPSTIAAALGLAVPSTDAMPAILAHLGRRSMLLVLDNCEHVIETAANAAEQVFSSSPGLHLLSTSREPLRAAGERVHRLPPLESPSRTAGLTADEALTFPCVQLFTERAAASLSDFRLTDAEVPFVAEICQRLDGIALAIELAAGRIAAFGVHELAARLDDRFRLLTSGRRTALPRHQTLAATLDWSYELLPLAQQTLLNRLSVFAGEFSLDAADAVMAGVETTQLIAEIADLVSKSLVVADLASAGVRYRLLETTRLYCIDKLRVGGSLAEVCRAHAFYIRGLFRTAEADAEAMHTMGWRAKYATQIDNLRAALGWAHSPTGDPALYIDLAISAVPLWVHLSLMGECRMWVERGLAMVGGEDRPALERRMRLTAALGWSLMYAAGRGSEVGATWAAALELADALEDMDYRLRAIWGVWISKLNAGDLDAALALATRLLGLVENSVSETDVMMADRLMGTTLHFRGDQDGARLFIDRMFARRDASPAPSNITRFHVDQKVPGRYFQARILWLQGHVDQALHAVRQNMQDGEALGQALSFASVLGQAACPISLLTGDITAARRYGAMLLQHSERHALHLWSDWARCFGGLVSIREGDVSTGLDVMRAAFDKAGDSRFLPRYMLLLGEYARCLGHAGPASSGLETINVMIARCERTEERWYEPEVRRIRGELLAKDAAVDWVEAAEAEFLHAIGLAEKQGARSWQLRAATSLARFRRDRGDLAGARVPLSQIYSSFVEGFATSDLRSASELLSKL